MAVGSSFEVHAIIASIRFIQGYRYLDRCGEALIKLEEVLAPGWITSEPNPKSGSLKNDELGLTAAFGSDSMSVTQTEYISFTHFLDQACRIYDALWQTFEVKRINVPAIRVIMQKGFDEDHAEEASRQLLAMQLCTPNPDLVTLLGGGASDLEFVLVTEKDVNWSEGRVHRRRRFQSQVVRQEKQLPFDERLFRRVHHLSTRQKEAMQALVELRKRHPRLSPVAVQLDMEDSFETEFDAEGFDLPTFMNEAWAWSQSVKDGISRLERGKT